MSLTSWLQSLRSRCQSSSSRSRQRAGGLGGSCDVRPLSGESGYGAECLEERVLPTVSALLIGTELNVTAEGSDSVTVRANAGGFVEVLDQNGLLTTMPSVSAAAIQALTITGGDNANVIDVSGVTALQFSLLSSVQVSGGDGDDRITGSPDLVNVLNGQNGADTLLGFAANDSLTGGDGADSLSGGLGNDCLLGGDGADTLSGEAGLDTLEGGNGADLLSAGDDPDSVNGGNGADNLDGGLGNDTLNGDGGSDTITGGADNDTILGGAENDSLLGGSGNDSILAQAGNDTVDGEAGLDTLSGGDGGDSVSGSDGDDVITGDSGNDTIAGNAGDDTMFGGAGNDLLFGDGTDSSSLESGNDSVIGQSGNDTLIGGQGRDTLDGGIGNDSVSGSFTNGVQPSSSPLPPATSIFTPLTTSLIQQDFDTIGSSYQLLSPAISPTHGIQSGGPTGNFFRFVGPTWRTQAQPVLALFDDTLVSQNTPTGITASFSFRSTTLFVGGDGVRFTLYPVGSVATPANAYIIPDDLGTGYPGVFHVIFDTFDNYQGAPDPVIRAREPNANHIEINYNGQRLPPVTGGPYDSGWIATITPPFTIDDGTWRTVNLSLTPSGANAILDLTVTQAGTTVTIAQGLVIPNFNWAINYRVASWASFGAAASLEDVDNIRVSSQPNFGSTGLLGAGDIAAHPASLNLAWWSVRSRSLKWS